MSSFASGERAATGPELREAQRRHGLVMAPRPARAAAGPGCLQLADGESLAALGPAAAATLAELQIDACTNPAALRRLVDLPALQTLRLGGMAGITDLRWLPPLPRLRALRVEGFGETLHSLEGIGAAPALEALVLDPGGGRATLQSLAPLAALGQLRVLALPAIAVADGSLQALAGLSRLELFHGTAYYGPDAYEALAASLPQLRCPWFSDAAWQLL